MPYYATANLAPNYQPNIVCSAPPCKKIITPMQAALMCSYCRSLFHPSCKGIIAEARIKKAAEDNWVCSLECGKSASSQPVPPAPSSPNYPTLPESTINSLVVRMDAQFAEVKSMIADIRKSQDFLCHEFDDYVEQTKKLASENLVLNEKCEALKVAYQKQEERINYMEAQMDVHHQKELEKNIVICGLPVNVPDISQFIADTITSINSNANITAIEKRKQFNNSKSTLNNSYIVTLNSVQMKNETLSKFKQCKLNSPTSSSVPRYHLLHHFTKLQAKLYEGAKQVQRAHNYRFLWVKEGKIFLRKNADSKIHHIFCQNDIFRLNVKPIPSTPNEHDDVSGTP